MPASAGGFVACYALGGTSSVPVGTVFAAMVSVHLLIGIGEALITAFTISSVIAVRPDLVHGAAGLRRPETLAVRPGGTAGTGPVTPEVPDDLRDPAGAPPTQDLAAGSRSAPWSAEESR